MDQPSESHKKSKTTLGKTSSIDDAKISNHPLISPQEMRESICIGFDGFIDTLLIPVKKRICAKKFTPFSSLKKLGEKIAAASGHNTNIELIEKTVSMGGNGPLIAKTLSSLGISTTLFSCCGFPQIHPLFSTLEENGGILIPIGNPGQTNAIECPDGKLLLGTMGDIGTLTLATVFNKISEKIVETAFLRAKHLVFVNWTMMPLVEEMLFYLDSLLQKHPVLPKKQVFLDLSDPSKRTKKDFKAIFKIIKKLSSTVDITISANKSESEQILALFNEKPHHISVDTQTIQKHTHVHTIIIHSRSGCAVSSGPCSIFIPISTCKKPIRTTGAGDVFNGGFLFGKIENQPLKRCLTYAIATSAIWARTGQSATKELLTSYIEETPDLF